MIDTFDWQQLCHGELTKGKERISFKSLFEDYGNCCKRIINKTEIRKYVGRKDALGWQLQN